MPAFAQQPFRRAGSRSTRLFSSNSELRGAQGRRSALEPIPIRRVLCYSRRPGLIQEAGDFSRSGGGGRQVPAAGEPTGSVHGDRRDGPPHDRGGDSECPAGVRRLRPYPAAQRHSPARDVRHRHDRQFLRRQGRVERSARHVHQGATSNRHRSRRRRGPRKHQRRTHPSPCSRRRGCMPSGKQRESSSTAWSCCSQRCSSRCRSGIS